MKRAKRKRPMGVVTAIDPGSNTVRISMLDLLRDAPSLKGFVEDAWTRRWKGSTE